MRSEQEFDHKITTSDGREIVIKNYDAEGEVFPVDIELEKDKFLHPEKYGKNESKS